jgi:hypothetical protein
MAYDHLEPLLTITLDRIKAVVNPDSGVSEREGSIRATVCKT